MNQSPAINHAGGSRRRRSATRRFILLAVPLALLAGVVVTCGVAWAIAWTANSREVGKWRRNDVPALPWPRSVPADWDTPEFSTSYWTPLETRHHWFRESGLAGLAADFGWPCRSLRGTTIASPDRNRRQLTWWTVWSGEPRLLPLEVLPLGFAVNSLLTAGVLLAATTGVGFARQRARAKRGQCPACGYHVRGIAPDAPCPECGALQAV